MRGRLAMLALLMSCGGSAQQQSRGGNDWIEKDDEHAAPICGSDCVSGVYGSADVREVVREVARCWPHPVYIEPDLSGVVTVEFKYMTCAEAIHEVARAARLNVMAVDGQTAGGHSLAGGAIALARRTRPGDLVDVSKIGDTGDDGTDSGLVDGGWSREVDDDDDGLTGDPDRAPDSGTDDRDDDSETARNTKAHRRSICRSKCAGPYSTCTRGCTNPAARESCLARCQSQREACLRPCDTM